jgi:nucleoside-diphosphate-sugar epimerase
MRVSTSHKLIVTGCAGFIGSNFVENACQSGYEVLGIDSFDSQLYSATLKFGNIAEIPQSALFSLVNSDMRTFEKSKGAKILVNFAGLPGQRLSWKIPFEYSYANLIAPLGLIEGLSAKAGLDHVIQISTSSVYGESATSSENGVLKPISPYGDSKLAAEFALQGLAKSLGFKLTILRLFSVYGPRQRPDMAFYRIIDRLLHGNTFEMFGDGEQSRTNTYVGDVSDWILRIIEGEVEGIFNIGGGEEVRLKDAISYLELISGMTLNINQVGNELGDQVKTSADCSKIFELLPFRPTTKIKDGLRKQFEWQKSLSRPLV